MTFREVLHIELWSKKASRKIFKVCGVLFVLLTLAVVVEFRWVTPHERSLAKIALSDVESLQQAETNEDTFEIRKEKARGAVDRADKVAWTLRDMKVVTALSAFEALAELDHERPVVQSKMSEILIRKDPQQASAQAQLNQTSDQVRGLLRQVLHNALD